MRVDEAHDTGCPTRASVPLVLCLLSLVYPVCGQRTVSPSCRVLVDSKLRADVAGRSGNMHPGRMLDAASHPWQQKWYRTR
ncbi:hypothetical protein BD289DRAFT_137530 [Coniella lustricola]|uniref:Uncharacterized protein n=1 Tax=Coniella lustricola TaxID=2025994 RepID=A0A2T2ZVL3_9PEZI|nr:hypothetical protein BD289DRAFT_137530 [Coniella lustricola]